MKLGILSDIHGNLEALKAAVKALKAEKVKQFVCLGDIIGYGADPLKCLKIIKKMTDQVIAGNHDHAALGLTSIENFNHWAKLSTAWTTQQLKKRHRRYIENLPLEIRHGDFLYVHSTPQHPEQWDYILSSDHAQFAFDTFPEKICFIGHSHQPIIFKKKNNTIETIQAGKIGIDPEARYIINVGSVGQPRDTIPEAAYCVYNLGTRELEIKRVPYAIQKTQAKIRKNHLPDYLADRLAKGR